MLNIHRLLYKQIYHGTAPCEMTSNDIKELVNKYKNSNDKQKKLLEKKYGRRQMQLVEKHLTTEYLKVYITNCKTMNRNIDK